MFSCKVLLITAGTFIIIFTILLLLIIILFLKMTIILVRSPDLHRMNATAGYKGVVGRTCKTDPNRCFFVFIFIIMMIMIIMIISIIFIIMIIFTLAAETPEET